ncbi:MAG TPA: hypothetical protein P5250_04530, partial [Bacteroidales bacterium]|nr:hypothetical protein [Bacteroidales bacterium]
MKTKDSYKNSLIISVILFSLSLSLFGKNTPESVNVFVFFNRWFYVDPKPEIPLNTGKISIFDSKNNPSLLKIAGVKNTQGSTGDTAIVVFIPGATSGFDMGFDGTKLMNTDPNIPNIFTVVNGTTYLAINAMPPLDTTMIIIPLGYSVNSSGQYKITAAEINDFPLG